MANFLATYEKITKLPFGHMLFNKGIGFTAPFFGKIRPNIIELKPTLCIAEMKDRRGLRNHIGTVNAGAMCTLAELVAGLALDAAMPAHLRWIPKKMTVAYLAKGKGTLQAICIFDEHLVRVGDVPVPVSIKNSQRETIFTAEITFHLSEKQVH